MTRPPLRFWNAQAPSSSVKQIATNLPWAVRTKTQPTVQCVIRLPGSCSRWFKRRLGRSGSRRIGRSFPGHRYGRIDSPAWIVLRGSRAESELWPRVTLRPDCLRIFARSHRALRPYRARYGYDDVRDRWTRHARCHFRLRASPGICCPTWAALSMACASEFPTIILAKGSILTYASKSRRA